MYMKEIKLYSPIEVTAFEGDNTYPTPINGIPYAEKIGERIKLSDNPSENKGLLGFLGQSISPETKNKLHSIHLSVIEKEDELYCVTTISLYDDKSLNKTEMKQITDYITGQYSDGIGEVIEQSPLNVEYGVIYVHLWQDSNWNLMSQTEFDELVRFKETIHKPDAPMIGADGNIFNQLSIAKKALVDNGQDYVAREMVKRAMDTKSYDEALRVISEYVNPVDKHYYIKPKGKKNEIKDR